MKFKKANLDSFLERVFSLNSLILIKDLVKAYPGVDFKLGELDRFDTDRLGTPVVLNRSGQIIYIGMFINAIYR